METYNYNYNEKLIPYLQTKIENNWRKIQIFLEKIIEEKSRTTQELKFLRINKNLKKDSKFSNKKKHKKTEEKSKSK